MRARIGVFAAVAVFAVLAALDAVAQTAQEADLIVDKSRILVEEMMLRPDNQVPENLIRKATGLALLPGMLKAGFILGGTYGQGVVLQRSPDGWNGPAFIGTGGGSVGVQFGGQSVDLILVIIGQDAMNAFMRNEFKLGADAALAAGPLGARISTATDISLKGGIYSYSRASGLFAGVSLEGAVVFSDEKLNRAYYTDTDSTAVILAGKVSLPESGRHLVETLQRIR
jgi:lipid-binding SYLF domain-containing protein